MIMLQRAISGKTTSQAQAVSTPMSWEWEPDPLDARNCFFGFNLSTHVQRNDALFGVQLYLLRIREYRAKDPDPTVYTCVRSVRLSGSQLLIIRHFGLRKSDEICNGETSTEN